MTVPRGWQGITPPLNPADIRLTERAPPVRADSALGRGAVFEVRVALSAPDVAMSDGAVHQEKIAGRAVGQRSVANWLDVV
jgi:hypothetical protein